MAVERSGQDLWQRLHRVAGMDISVKFWRVRSARGRIPTRSGCLVQSGVRGNTSSSSMVGVHRSRAARTEPERRARQWPSFELISRVYFVITTSPKICVHSDTMFPTTWPALPFGSIHAYPTAHAVPLATSTIVSE